MSGGARGITPGRLAVLLVLALAVAITATLLATRSGDDPPGDGRLADGRPADGSTPTAGPTPPGAPYAYTTEKELVLMRGERRLARVPRVFDLADAQRNTVVWTHDGRYAAFLSDDAMLDRPDDSRLISVDASTGAVRRLPCPQCYDLAPVGDHEVFVLSTEPGPTSAYRFDLDQPDGARTEPDNGSYWQPYLLGATRTHVLTGDYEMSGGDPGMELRLNDLSSGGITVYSRLNSNAYMPAALTSAGGRDRIAVAARNNPGGCAAPFPIHPLGLSGQIGGTYQDAALPPGFVAGVTGGIDVQDLWWGPDHHLYASISAWTCEDSERAENDQKRPHRPATLFRLDGERWVSAGGQPATMVRPTGPDTRAVLVIPDCNGPVKAQDRITYCNAGVLFRERDGKRTKITGGVLSLSAPPSAS
ncbi:hypothetical protein [Streptomyces sp. ODS05-4]|uniref:hypothetical protein n=1 Tax=Streptomyces sp. ODS05-4 TaxID=2944939 RepID=UPI00210AC964|nr:hypothetical protein [Streptomyces sp. ODS05-4]